MLEIATKKDRERKEEIAPSLGLKLLFPGDYKVIDDKDSLSTLKRERKKKNLIIVRTKTRKRLMWALKKTEVDAVLYPFSEIKTDTSVANLLSKNDIAVIIKPSNNFRELKAQMKAVSLLEKKNTPVIFSKMAENWYDLRDWRTLLSYGVVLGFSKEFVYSKKKVLEGIIERNKKIRGEKG